MKNPLVHQLLDLLEDSFAADEEHSFMANALAVPAAHWHSVPAGGGRSVATVAWHVGAANFIYANHAFGDGALRWGVGRLADRSTEWPRNEMLVWAVDGYEHLRHEVELLQDADLEESRPVHYGGTRSVRSIIFLMVEHHAYHAGEVNHVRAMLTGTDRWPGG